MKFLAISAARSAGFVLPGEIVVILAIAAVIFFFWAISKD